MDLKERGRPGLWGWIIRKWDVFQLTRAIKRAQRVRAKIEEIKMTDAWRKEQVYRNGATRRDEEV